MVTHLSLRSCSRSVTRHPAGRADAGAVQADCPLPGAQAPAQQWLESQLMGKRRQVVISFFFSIRHCCYSLAVPSL